MTDKKSSQEREHAEISSSKINVQLKCSGSVVLGRSLPQIDPTDAMLSGTKTHDIAEMGLEDYIQYKVSGSDPDVRIGALLKGDPEREERVRGYIEAVFEKGLEGSISGKAYAIEDKLVLHEEFGIFGYSDLWLAYKDDRAKRVGLIVDLKDGRTPVDIKSDQLKFLGSALIEEFRRKGIELSFVRCAIYQTTAPEGERYKEVKYSAKQLDVFKSKVLKLAENIYLKQKYSFKTGDHCRYCKAQQLCMVYGKSLENKSSLKLLDPKAIEFPPPEVIPDETLRNIVLHSGALEEFIKACKKLVFSRHVTGKPIEGLKLVEGNSKRRMDKAKELDVKQFFESHGINPFEPKMKGIGKLGAELKKKGLSKNLVDSFCTTGVKPIILVDSNDPRPEVKNPLDLLNEQKLEEIEEND